MFCIWIFYNLESGRISDVDFKEALIVWASCSKGNEAKTVIRHMTQFSTDSKESTSIDEILREVDEIISSSDFRYFHFTVINYCFGQYPHELLTLVQNKRRKNGPHQFRKRK